MTVDQPIRVPSNDISKNKPKPANYVHASNPSLASSIRVGDLSTASGSKSGKGNDSLSGFVTLEELMIRQSEENRKNPYYEAEQMRNSLRMIQPDVVYGNYCKPPKLFALVVQMNDGCRRITNQNFNQHQRNKRTS